MTASFCDAGPASCPLVCPPAPGGYVEPALPNALAYCVAEPVPVDPPQVRGGGYTVPLEQAGFATAAVEAELGRKYCVFEYQKRPRLRARGQTWSLQDTIADAIRSAAAPIRHVRVLQPGLAGYPEPQLVLTRRDPPHGSFAVPCDLREATGEVITAQLAGPVQLHMLPEHVRDGSPAPAFFRFPVGPCAWIDDAGRVFRDAPPAAGGLQWLRWVAAGAEVPSDASGRAGAAAIAASEAAAAQGTTGTTTGMRTCVAAQEEANPVQLLIDLAAAEHTMQMLLVCILHASS